MSYKLTIDLESRSRFSLQKGGMFAYAEHESTDILCFAFKVDNQAPWLWVPDKFMHLIGEKFTDIVPSLCNMKYVFELINGAKEIEAHNAGFELAMWHHIMHKRYGFPDLDVKKVHCSAAKAAYYALPRSLGEACAALGVSQQKDKEGYTIMMKFAKPRKPTKSNPNEWYEDPEDFEKLCSYCMQDTWAEYALSEALFPLPESERKVWLLDYEINSRGIPVDVVGIENLKAKVQEKETKLLFEVQSLTNGSVKSARQIDKTVDFLNGEGLALENLRKSSVEEFLTDDTISPTAKRILEIRQSLGKSSIKKLDAMLECACADGRVRGAFMYHGATTGRWCLDDQSEVLTPFGWVSIDQWLGEEIAVWSPATNEIAFEFVDMHGWKFEGDLVKVQASYINFAVTPEHKILYKTQRGNSHVVDAKTILEKRLSIPLSGNLKSDSSLDLKTRILVMAQADGHFIDGDKGKYLRFGFKKERKIERCKELLTLAGIKFKVRQTASESATRIVVSRDDMPFWLWDFKDKDFTIFRYTDLDLIAFIDEVYKWDGTKPTKTGSFEYSTTRKGNAYFVATVAHLTSRGAWVLPVDKNSKWNTCYRVFIRPQSYARVAETDAKLEHYSGHVFCPATSTGFFLMRRNGLISITGNSGKLIQPQNYPRDTYGDDDIETILDIDTETIELLYGCPMQVASKCLRGMIKASPGKTLVGADFSAIEARVLAWVANEEKALKAYREGLDIYKVNAVDIFGVKYEDVTKDQRQVGKVCIAEGELVLTDSGLAPIEKVTVKDLVWDGVDFVRHNGVICNGYEEVISYAGLTATPDHKVYIEGQTAPVEFRDAKEKGARLVTAGNGRTPIRTSENNFSGSEARKTLDAVLESPMCDLSSGILDKPIQSTTGKNTGLSELLAADKPPFKSTGEAISRNGRSLQQPEKPAVQKLRSAGDTLRVSFALALRFVGCKKPASSELPRRRDRPDRQQRELCTGKSAVSEPERKPVQSPHNPIYYLQRIKNSVVRRLSRYKNIRPKCEVQLNHVEQFDNCGANYRANNRTVSQPLLLQKKRVYDITNCGPRHRFTVSNVLVSNCELALGYQGYTGAFSSMASGYGVNLPEERQKEIINAWRESRPMTTAFWKGVELAALQAIRTKEPHAYGPIKFGVRKQFLHCRLPSGRLLSYPFPHTEVIEDKYKRKKEVVSFFGVDTTTKKWSKQFTYGGSLTENIVQAIARDLLVEAMLAVNEYYPVVMHVHDEVLCEATEAKLSLFETTMTKVPVWAKGCPINAEAWKGERYRK